MRFLAINPHLAFIRETHRLVLTWTLFADDRVIPFTVTLTKRDLRGCREALAADSASWQSEDSRLTIRTESSALVLTFRTEGLRPDESTTQDLTLAGDERTRFEQALSELA